MLKPGFAFFCGLSACAAQSSRVSTPSTPDSSAHNAAATIESLEREEFAKPKDPGIKMELARRLWCRKQRGPAFEHWQWVEQFGNNEALKKESLLYLALSRKDPDELSDKLSCEDLIQAR